jgi:phage shock protein PspC (stress-responsive transcriptional regulator)
VRRATKDKWVAGVCGGMAHHLGIPPLAVRISAVVIASVAAPVYIVMWVLVPTTPDF